MTVVFCDGIELRLSEMRKEDVVKTKQCLLNEVHQAVTDLTIKNILVKQRGRHTFLWITLKCECSEVNSRFLTRMKALLRVVTRHARLYWTDN